MGNQYYTEIQKHTYTIHYLNHVPWDKALKPSNSSIRIERSKALCTERHAFFIVKLRFNNFHRKHQENKKNIIHAMPAE